MQFSQFNIKGAEAIASFNCSTGRKGWAVFRIQTGGRVKIALSAVDRNLLCFGEATTPKKFMLLQSQQRSLNCNNNKIKVCDEVAAVTHYHIFLHCARCLFARRRLLLTGRCGWFVSSWRIGIGNNVCMMVCLYAFSIRNGLDTQTDGSKDKCASGYLFGLINAFISKDGVVECVSCTPQWKIYFVIWFTNTLFTFIIFKRNMNHFTKQIILSAFIKHQFWFASYICNSLRNRHTLPIIINNKPTGPLNDMHVHHIV